MGKSLVAELRTVYNADKEDQAMEVLENLVAKYSSEATSLAKWLEKKSGRSDSLLPFTRSSVKNENIKPDETHHHSTKNIVNAQSQSVF